jgi:virginiamycin B lyase
VGRLALYEPATGTWREWHAPHPNAHVYAVWVDENDAPWISEWSEGALLRFDPATGKFERATAAGGYANVRQILGRHGETWGAESGSDRLVRVTP